MSIIPPEQEQPARWHGLLLDLETRALDRVQRRQEQPWLMAFAGIAVAAALCVVGAALVLAFHLLGRIL